MVMVLGSMEDERIFSNLALIKTKLWNCFITHLDLVVQMYAHKFYDLAICDWNEHHLRYGVDA